jgi:hypothetical protein
MSHRPVQVPGAPASTMSSASRDAALHTDREQHELRLEILWLEREFSAMRVDLLQFQRLVDNGVGQYRGALAAKQADCDALEARLKVLHARKR